MSAYAWVATVLAVVGWGGVAVLLALVMRPFSGNHARIPEKAAELPKRGPRAPDRSQDYAWVQEELADHLGWNPPEPLPPFRGSQELHGPGPDPMDRVVDEYLAGRHARVSRVAGLSGGADRRMHRGVWNVYAAMSMASAAPGD